MRDLRQRYNVPEQRQVNPRTGNPGSRVIDRGGRNTGASPDRGRTTGGLRDLRERFDRNTGVGSLRFRVESEQARSLRQRFGLPTNGSTRTTSDLPTIEPRRNTTARPDGRPSGRIVMGDAGRTAELDAKGLQENRGRGSIVRNGPGLDRNDPQGRGRRNNDDKRGGIVGPGEKGSGIGGIDRRGGIVTDRGGRVAGDVKRPGIGRTPIDGRRRLAPRDGITPKSDLRRLKRPGDKFSGVVRRVPPVKTAGIVTGSTVAVPLVFNDPWVTSPYFYVGFPYRGYYSLYNFPYLSFYGCDFYSSFYVRFGHFRFGLYSLCSPFYYRYYPYRHSHRSYCYRHSCYHYYRLRDCSYCYDHGSDHTIYQTIVYESPQADEKVQALQPGELSFCEGWSLLRSGDYKNSAEAFYQASVEIPESALAKLFLALALVGDGEYEIAAATLEEAYGVAPSIIGLKWNVEKHLGSREKYDELVSTLRGFLDVSPGDASAWNSLAYLQLISAESRDDYAAVRRAAGEVVLFEGGGELAPAMLAEAERRDFGEQPLSEEKTPDPTVVQWLAMPACESIGALRLGVN